MSPARMTFWGHLSELRQRIIVCLVAVVIGIAACWPFAPRALGWLLEPLGRPTIFLGPAEGFIVTFKVAAAGGIILALPLIAWHMLAFTLPALKRNEKRIAGMVLAFGGIAFAAGVWVGWTLLIPVMIRFFMSFDSEVMQAQIAADRYLSFILFMLLGAGLSFEFPIVTAGLAALRLITARTLIRRWRYCVLGCFVLAAVLTPSPDAATMLLVAAMLLGLYLAGVGTAALFGRR